MEQVVKKLLAAVIVTASFANAGSTRYRRSTNGFHEEFIREVKTVIQAASMCTNVQFYDLELETCKDCEKHCPANACGQCTDYYNQKSSAEITDSVDGKLSHIENIDIAQWVCLAVLLLLIIGIVVYLVLEMRKKNKDKEDQNKSVQFPTEVEGATVKKNKAVAQNNRKDAEIPAPHSSQPRQSDSPALQESHIGRRGNTEKVPH